MLKYFPRYMLLASLTAACTSTPVEVAPDIERAPITRTPASDGASAPAPKPNQATRVLLQQAGTAAGRHDHSTAIVYLERAVRIDPRDARLWSALARSHLAIQNLSAAEQHARKAVSMSSADPGVSEDAWLTLADVYDALGEPDTARDIRSRFLAGSDRQSN